MWGSQNSIGLTSVMAGIGCGHTQRGYTGSKILNKLLLLLKEFWFKQISLPIFCPTFFFWVAHLLRFFLMGVSLQFFCLEKIKSACENVFDIFLYFYGQKNDFTNSTGGADIISSDRPGTNWFLDIFLLLFKQIPFFLNLVAHF